MKRLLPTFIAVALLCGVSFASAGVIGVASSGYIGFASAGVQAFGFQVPARFGVNYGHFHVTSASLAPGGTVSTDFANLAASGVKNIRIRLDWSDATASNALDLGMATTSVAMGFTTTWGYDSIDPGTNLASSSIATYMTQVLALEPTIQAAGIQNFSMGNEMEEQLNTSDISIAQFEYDMQELACQVKAAGYTGVVSYQAQDGDIANWNTNYQHGTSCLDLIGFNEYGSASFMAGRAATIIADFGSHGYMSEFEAHGGSYPVEGCNAVATLNTCAADNQAVVKTLAASGLSQYNYFTYRSDNVYNTGHLDAFALINETGNLPFIGQVLGLP